MDIVFRHGPWHSFLDGRSGQHEFQLLSDNASTILSLIWDVQGKETVGVALEWLRVFVATQNPGVLIEKAGFDCLGITKKEGQSVHWFLTVKSSPVYAPLDQKKIDLEMDNAALVMQGNEKRLMALANALAVPLRPLHASGPAERSLFFESPLVYKMLSYSVIEEKLDRESNSLPVVPRLLPLGEFLIGVDKQKQVVKEPLGLFRRTVVLDGQQEDRLHALHLLMESASLSHIPCVVFDAKNWFSGLHRPNNDTAQLKELNLEPVGFPTASFSCPEKVRVNLSMLNVESVLELFRAGRTPAIQVVQALLEKNAAETLEQLVEAVQSYPPLGEVSSFQLRKAIRIVRLIAQTYPNFFNGPNDWREIAKQWGSGFTRIGVIKTEGLDDRIKLILFHALVRELKQYCRTMRESRPLKLLLVIPEVRNLLPRNLDLKILSLIEQDLQDASAFGLGSVLSVERVSELSRFVALENQTVISIVQKRDVGIRIEHRRPYRVLLRSGVSECTEKAEKPFETSAKTAEPLSPSEPSSF